MLLSLSIPSIADKKVLQLSLIGVVVDFSFFQVFLVLSTVWIICTKSKVSIGRVERVLIIIFCGVVPYNMLILITNNYHLFITSLRGIFNFGVNILCAFWLSYIIKRWLNTKLFATVFVLFGIILALSGIAEFSFLKFSPKLLDKWRSLVWGEVIEPEELLTAGGVILNTDGMARVGGLIGAPENLGVILAFTLPFAILLRISLLSHIGIVGLYTLVSIIASTRMLGISLILYIIILLQKSKEFLILKFFSLFIISLIVVGLIFLDINTEAQSRFTLDAFLYELLWRSEILTRFLETTRMNDISPFIGASLGQFERDSEYDVIARANSGILGGDVVVAYGLGGIGGILILSILWREIWKIRNKTLKGFNHLQHATKLFMILLVLKSLFMPVLISFVLISNILTFTSIAVLMSLSALTGIEDTGERDDE
jgi:hypothetical protein